MHIINDAEIGDDDGGSGIFLMPWLFIIAKPEIDRENSKTIIIILLYMYTLLHYLVLNLRMKETFNTLLFFFACRVNPLHVRKHSLPHTYRYLPIYL